MNTQEKEPELGEGVTSAEFWVYDGKLGRRWNVDLVDKVYESSYGCFGNNPISVIDPNGADSIFYNQQGAEINRILCPGDHAYFLEHDNGNKNIKGKNYYQGNSYYSFFGDNEAYNSPGVFKKVDLETCSDRIKVDKIVELNIDKSKRVHRMFFMIYSQNRSYWDYKNREDLLGENQETAYMYEGVLYNRNEMGNILWGATAYCIGYSKSETERKVDFGHEHFENDHIEELHEWNAILIGRSHSSKITRIVPSTTVKVWDWSSLSIKKKKRQGKHPYNHGSEKLILNNIYGWNWRGTDHTNPNAVNAYEFHKLYTDGHRLMRQGNHDGKLTLRYPYIGKRGH